MNAAIVPWLISWATPSMSLARKLKSDPFATKCLNAVDHRSGRCPQKL
jgi:hypothetical protein